MKDRIAGTRIILLCIHIYQIDGTYWRTSIQNILTAFSLLPMTSPQLELVLNCIKVIMLTKHDDFILKDSFKILIMTSLIACSSFQKYLPFHL